MTAPKFKLGEKVRLSKRAPKHMAAELVRSRTRTVVDTMYDPDHRCTYYELGARGKGTTGHWFRSFDLMRVTGEQTGKRGRPREKRKYTRRQA